MNQTYRIAIADDNDEDRALLCDSLSRAGHQVIIEAISGEELVKQCMTTRDGAVQLVITDVNMKGMSGLEAAAQIQECCDIPFIILSDREDDQSIEQASTYRAFAYLVKPVRESELKAAIFFAAQRSQELQSLRSEATSLRQALEDRKTIERAKGILMRERSLDERDAFAFLQQLARQNRQKLVDLAKSINLAEEVLGSNK